MAWERRDSTEIQLVLADDYEGTSTDISAGGPEILTFTKSDEVRAVHNMRADATLTRMEVNFGPMSSWIPDSYAGDPQGWVVLHVHDVSIRLLWASGDEVVVSPSSTDNEFKLKPVALGTDTTWQIVSWKEVHTTP
jgi:hypothetical protein